MHAPTQRESLARASPLWLTPEGLFNSLKIGILGGNRSFTTGDHMKKKYAILLLGFASVAIITALLTLRDIRIENELIETCGAVKIKGSVEEMEEVVREKYPQAGEKKEAKSVEVAPETDVWMPYAWRIAVGPEGVTQGGFGPFRIIRHKWHYVYIGKRAEDKYVTRGGSLNVSLGGYGFMRVKSRKSSANTDCAIEKTAFTNWKY